jgi:hypothetical protein
MYIRTMRKVAVTLLLICAGSPAIAGPGAGNFNLVNGTPGALGNVSISRAGANDWKPLGTARSAGASGPVQFKDPDCAFDIRADSAGKPVTWAGVNLCDVKSVILKQDENAGAWVDYDQ